MNKTPYPELKSDKTDLKILKPVTSTSAGYYREVDAPRLAHPSSCEAVYAQLSRYLWVSMKVPTVPTPFTDLKPTADRQTVGKCILPK